MNLPVYLALSHDEQLSRELQDALDCGGRVIPLTSTADVRRAAAETPTQGVVLDFRQSSSGGHDEAELINDLVSTADNISGWVLAPNPCPEPILRAAAGRAFRVSCTEIPIREMADDLMSRATFSVDDGTTIIRPTRGAKAASMAYPSGDHWNSSLSGLTRRFETDTPRLKLTLGDLEVAARHDVTILLVGETGSGKTYLARILHEISHRREQPFVTVACGAIPADLLESEMFGHKRGAFTGAQFDKDGKFLVAGQGTMLLDEIDVLGIDQQVKLLRVIESGEFEPVGSNVTLHNQARLIVASNHDLEPLVEQRKFRPDLYYRLNMMKFEIPPLRKRPRDIVPLARKFIRQHAVKHGVQIRAVDPELFAVLQQYSWPGNVRELEHVLQRAVIFCRDGHLTTSCLPSHVVQGQPGPGNNGDRPVSDIPTTDLNIDSAKLQHQRELSERDAIEQALREHNHSRKNTAQALGISRVTLYNKMKKYGITM